jgi:hypothetical protein
MRMLGRHSASIPLAGLALATAILNATPVAATADFCSRVDVTVPINNPVAAVAADFYGADGDLDVAVSFAGSTVSAVVIFENDGTGNFAPVDTLADAGAATNSSVVADGPTNMVAADFDMDGLVDLAGGNRGVERFFAYSNPGVGTWSAPLDPDATRGNGFDVVAVNWNADAALDLVFAYDSGQVGIALGVTAGGPPPVPTGEWRPVFRTNVSGTVGFLTDVEVGEFRAPASSKDILSVDATTRQLVIWPGAPIDGQVLFGPADLVLIPTVVPGFGPVNPFEAIVNDWSGDGRLDALVGTTQGFVLFYRGNGTATVFDPPVVTDVAMTYSASLTRIPTEFTAMVLADVVPGGGLDLVMLDAGDPTSPTGFNWLTVVPGITTTPAPTFDVTAQVHHAVGPVAELRPAALLVDEFDGQAGLDALVLNGNTRSMTLFHGDGAGGFVAPRSYSAGGSRPRGAAAADLDRDGIGDIVLTLPGSNAPAILLGDGSGGLTASRILAAPALFAPRAVQIATLDADALPDLLVTYGSDQAFWSGNGDGTFDPPRVLSGVAGDVRVGELRGSAARDLVTVERSPSSRVRIWQGDGAGGFTLQQTIANVFGYTDHVVGDFFGGAKDDIIVAGSLETGEPGLYVIRYDDATSAHLPPEFIDSRTLFGFDPGPDFYRLGAGDFTEDGLLDLFGATSGGQGIMLINDGAELDLDPRTLSQPIDLVGTPTSLLVADLTGDGILDIASTSESRVGVREGTGDGSFQPLIVLASNISNDALAAIDLDGDALPELVAVSSNTSDVTVFCNATVEGLTLRIGRPLPRTTLHWEALGASTYDVARGNLFLLRVTNRDLRDVTCLANDLAALQYDDPTPVPAAQPQWRSTSGFYYLIRCQGVDCADPTFGTRSDGVARFAPGSEPCP